MINIWFTSDLHFCHDRDFIYKPRGCNSVEEMNKKIINNWNTVVNKDDIVYVLGDLMLGELALGVDCLKQLKGNIKIIIGNHDTNNRINAYKNLPNVEVLGYGDRFKYKGIIFYLSHYPTITDNYEENKSIKTCVINLYGHTHQQDNFYNDNPCNYHVGVDSHDCTPVCIDIIIEEIKNNFNRKEKL